MTWAYGKAILLGEHAVVYGHPALAGAIDCTLRCTATAADPAARAAPGPGAGPAAGGGNGASARASAGRPRLRLRVPAWGVDAVVDLTTAAAPGAAPAAATPAGAVNALITCLGAHWGCDVAALLGAVDLEIATRLPAAAGLGSSAALAVALTRALAERLGRPLSDREVESIADSAERCFHNNPSGVDVALATRGGLGLFERGRGLAPIAAAPLALAVGLVAEPRSTAAMVARVAAARAANPAVADADLAALGTAARQGAAAVAAGDRVQLGALMSSAHKTLAGLGVSTPKLDELVAIARSAGAYGAKLTGAGGGGAVIAVGGEADVVAAWAAAGYDGFTCRVGVRPDLERDAACAAGANAERDAACAAGANAERDAACAAGPDLERDAACAAGANPAQQAELGGEATAASAAEPQTQTTAASGAASGAGT